MNFMELHIDRASDSSGGWVTLFRRESVGVTLRSIVWGLAGAVALPQNYAGLVCGFRQ
jgi:hypothetical protein